MNLLDHFADVIEDRYQQPRLRPRRRRNRLERQQRKEEFGWTINGPTIDIAELLKSHRGKTLPVGDNAYVKIPANLAWNPNVFGDHVRLEFTTPIRVEVDSWIDWELDWLAFEDWPDRVMVDIRPKLAVVDRLRLPKDWSSP